MSRHISFQQMIYFSLIKKYGTVGSVWLERKHFWTAVKRSFHCSASIAVSNGNLFFMQPIYLGVLFFLSRFFMRNCLQMFTLWCHWHTYVIISLRFTTWGVSQTSSCLWVPPLGVEQPDLALRYILGHWRFLSTYQILWHPHCLATSYKWDKMIHVCHLYTL